MTLRFAIEHNKLPAESAELFPEISAFHDPATMSAFNSDWYGVLVADGKKAMMHTLVVSAIGETGYYDIEPWFGYGGPTTNTNDGTFNCEALKLYSEHCKQLKIIAEVIRFDPLKENHEQFSDANLKVICEKPLIYIPVFKSDDEQLSSYKEPCRRKVRQAANSGMSFLSMDGMEKKWDIFQELYYKSLERVGADKVWFLNENTFDRLQNADKVELFGIADPGGSKLVSACACVSDNEVMYYLLAANDEPANNPGANNLLIHGLTQTCRSRNILWLCLGGGNSSSVDDPLFVFKRKFAQDVRHFPLGFAKHDSEAYDELCRQSKTESTIFLHYRLSPQFSPGRYQCAKLN